MSVLDSVASKLASYNSYPCYTPPATSKTLVTLNLIGYSADTARKSSIYDRVAVAPTGTKIYEGDVVEIGSESFIVSMTTMNSSFGSIYEKTVNLIDVYDIMSFSRVSNDNTSSGSFLGSSETIVYEDIPCGLRKIEIDIAKHLQTVKESYYIFAPVGLDVKIKDVIEVPKLSAKYTVESIVPFANGVHTLEVVEQRVL